MLTCMSSSHTTTPMTDKLTYFDVLMYVLPGAYALTIALGGWWCISPSAISSLPLTGDGGLFASVVFVLMSFIAGNALQVIAHTLPESLIRRVFWSGHWASQLAFFKSGPCLSEKERSAVIESAVRLCSADPAVLGVLTVKRLRGGRWRPEGDPAAIAATLDSAQAVFRGALALLADTGAGQRATTANAYYQFFRALFTMSAIATVGFGGLAFEAHWKAWIGLPIGAVVTARLPLLVSAVFTLLFGWRARGAGEALVRETLLSLSVLEKTKALGSAPPPAPAE